MRHYRTLLQKLINSIEGKKLSVLDVGCWRKQYESFFNGRESEYIGLDLYKDEFIDVVGDVQKLPFPAKRFDVVLCLEVLEHVENPWKGAAEIHRVLKDGGTSIFSAPLDFPPPPCPKDYWRFTPDGWHALLNQFDKVEVHRVGNAATSLFLTPTSYASQLPSFFWPLKGAVYLADIILETVFHQLLDSKAFTAGYLACAVKSPSAVHAAKKPHGKKVL